eukprot:COSAG04_NODE_417_length_14700_cov_114.213709_8_plen_1093_part_00
MTTSFWGGSVEQYAQTAETARSTIEAVVKAGGPRVQLLIGGFVAYGEDSFQEALGKAGALAHADGLSFHLAPEVCLSFGCAGPFDNMESFAVLLAQRAAFYRNCSRQYIPKFKHAPTDSAVPLWSTEGGTDDTSFLVGLSETGAGLPPSRCLPPLNFRAGAARTVVGEALMQTAGIQAHYYYWQAQAPPHGWGVQSLASSVEGFANTNMLDLTLAPRPKLLARLAFQERIASCRLPPRLARQKGAWCFVYTCRNDTGSGGLGVMLLWSERSAVMLDLASIEPRLRKATARWDVFGNRQTVPSRVRSVAVQTDPQYVSFEFVDARGGARWKADEEDYQPAGRASACLDTKIHAGTDSSGDWTSDSPLQHSGPGATPQWCRSLCCARAECIAFTFTDPQPGTNGTAVDCWLKTKNVQLLPGHCGSSPPGTLPGRCWSGVLPPKPPPPLHFVPLFSLSGYDSRSSKWLFVRPSVPISDQLAADWHVTATVSGGGALESSTTVALPFAGVNWGVQLFGPLDLTSATSTVKVRVNYFLRSNHSAGGSARTITVPVVAGRRRAFQRLVRGLALANAVERNFSKYDSRLGGGGFVDCNSCMGEANSHGSFLAGLAAVHHADTNTSGATYLPPTQRSPLAAHMAMAVRYLLQLQRVSGEIRHEYCQNFSRPSASSCRENCSCRENYPGYAGPHHSAMAMVGLLDVLHSLDSVQVEQIDPELRPLLPKVLRAVNSTHDFLRRGAPLSSVVNGSAGTEPSCVGGDCYVIPYWPELVPSYHWVRYRLCKAWDGSDIADDCGSLQQMRARAVRATRDLYANYSLRQRVRQLTTDEGTFRGAAWFQALHLAHLTALDEDDRALEEEAVTLAMAIGQQYSSLGNQFHVLPLMIDASNTRDTPRFPANPQGQGLGNAALGMQALDASFLGTIIARGVARRQTEASVSVDLVQLMERWSSAAVSWVQGLSPGVPCSATSWAQQNGTRSLPSVCAASMVVHAKAVDDGSPVHFLLPWSQRWWSGGASCGHSAASSKSADTFEQVPAVMTIVNGLGTTNTWTVGFPGKIVILSRFAVLSVSLTKKHHYFRDVHTSRWSLPPRRRRVRATA